MPAERHTLTEGETTLMPNPDPATSTRPGTGPPTRPGPIARLACPACGSTSLSTVEQLTGAGRCRAIQVRADGTLQCRWTGWTDISWDSSRTVGLQCDQCGHVDRGGRLEEIATRFARRPDAAPIGEQPARTR
jgi:hypothetical protein